ncbi:MULTISPECIES: hypothetical protein [unclassified Mycolicibacterium]|uniref:hypothetical protein n=1 Tax=unclassified Mycolicibacterium TaxID=2636767 RepID=UPI002ED9A1A5
MSLQDGIDQAGTPIQLLWQANSPRWHPPVLPLEFVGWREEQFAAHQSVALSDLSHHMWDTFVEGPDALRLLSETTANNYNNFAIGQAKQLVAVTERGHIVSDDIVARDSQEKFTISGVPFAQSWVRYHAETGNYDVSVTSDPDSFIRGGLEPVMFRYQIQGPQAEEVVAKAFGAPLPKMKFFHSVPVTLAGRTFRAHRHGMTGQPGYEFSGNWADSEYVKQALLEAGESFGLVQVGALAYSTSGVPSGWISLPVPAIYTTPELANYRQWMSLNTMEGRLPMYGSYFSEDIEDYYTNPYELGYAKSISFNHDFIGREALEKAQHNTTRKRVTIVVDRSEARRIWGPEIAFEQTHGLYRVEIGDRLVGVARYMATYAPAGTALALALIDEDIAPGSEVTFVWGRHPGPGTAPDADTGFTRVKATVQPAPYDEFARTGYRNDT